MQWYRELQFIAAVPMPIEWAREFGTTVNGMWADPDRWGKAEVAQAHAEGRRVLVSVPVIALTHRVYEQDEHRHLMSEVCRDILGRPAEVKWYYWDSKPVYAMCLYSRAFRDHLLAKIRKAIEAGADVINVDEIQTNIGLMSRRAKDPGYCPRCLELFCAHLDRDASARRAAGVESVADLRRNDYSALLQRLREDDALYQLYLSFQERAAFATIKEFLSEIRAAIAAARSEMAVTANLTGLGTFLETNGRLWGAMWGELLDFVLMENIYLTELGAFESGPGHRLLPRGKFTAWYRLASCFPAAAPAWFCPQIYVPKQLAGKKAINYYLLMFLEAYANYGRWGYYWAPGVDKETRRAATLPEAVKDYTQFMLAHRDCYEGCATDNDLLVLYANSAMLANPQGHFKYLALAQALAEAGYQYDVLYSGDDLFTPGEIAQEALGRYTAVLVPEAGSLTDQQQEALRRYAAQGGRVIAYSGNELGGDTGITTIADDRLLEFWRHYQDRDRLRILSPLEGLDGARVFVSDAHAGIVCYRKEGQLVCHVLNYHYQEADDTIPPMRGVEVAIPWSAKRAASVRWLSLQGEQELPARVEGDRLRFTIPLVDPYGLAIVG